MKDWEERLGYLPSLHANDEENNGYCMSFYTCIWLLV